MDWLTFWSKVIEALAWPATLIALILIVRKELPQIARSLRKLKFKDVELEFGEAAKAVAQEVREAVPEPAAEQLQVRLKGELKSEAQGRLQTLAGIAPRAAILEAWLLVESAAADVIQRKGLAPPSAASGPLRLRESLQRAGLLRPRQMAAFEQLRALRNEAVHTPEVQFTESAVSSYIESALAMAGYLEGLALGT